jgi:hypothetical protein
MKKLQKKIPFSNMIKYIIAFERRGGQGMSARLDSFAPKALTEKL